jgi:hypothetical protein
VAKWVNHLEAQYKGKAGFEDVRVDAAAVMVYQNHQGVPPSTLAMAAAAATADEDAMAQGVLHRKRDGYAATRYGSAEDAAAGAATAAAAAAAGDERGSMTGLDEMDLQFDPAADIDTQQALAAAANKVADAQTLLKNGGILASRCSNTLGDDCSRYMPLRKYPTVYPWGLGARPKGMSEEQEVLLLATRYPSSQFSDNIPFMLHRFNMLQRHSNLNQSFVTLRTSPQLIKEAGGATQADVQLVLDVLKAGGKGDAVQQRLAAASPAAKALLKAYRVTGEVLANRGLCRQPTHATVIAVHHLLQRQH